MEANDDTVLNGFEAKQGIGIFGNGMSSVPIGKGYPRARRSTMRFGLVFVDKFLA